MEHDHSSEAFILARQAAQATPGAAVRSSSAARVTVFDDPRLAEQLEGITGQRLSQFSMAINGIRLQFWGDQVSSPSQEIYIEHPTVELSRPGQPAVAHGWNSDIVATSLLSALNHAVSSIDLADGYLTVVFDDDLQLRVEPDQHYESWQISSDHGLLIVCAPGGSPTIWYPDTPA